MKKITEVLYSQLSRVIFNKNKYHSLYHAPANEFCCLLAFIVMINHNLLISNHYFENKIFQSLVDSILF